MDERERDKQPPAAETPARIQPERLEKRPRPPLAQRLREKLEKLRKDDNNVYPLY